MPPINHGSQLVAALRIGVQIVSAAYVGSQQTYSAVAVKLLDFSEGAFSALRPISRGYLTSSSTISVVGNDVPRYEDRGDGYGPVLLLEGQCTNQWSNPEAAGGAINGCVITADNIVAPDGAMTADSAAFAANVNSAFGGTVLSNSAVPDNTKVTISGWAYSASGGLIRIWSNDKSNVDKSTSNIAIGPGWTQISSTFNVGSGASNFTMRIRNATDAAVRTVSGWALNFTNTAFPVSYIKGNQGAVGHPDVLTFLAAQVPLQLRAGFSRWKVYPYYANTDLSSGDKYTIASFGGASDVLQIRHDGTSVIVEAVAGGVVKATSGALTFARHAQLNISVDAGSGSITVNAAPGPTGTAWTWPAGVQMRVGGVLAANAEFWGRISEPESA